MSIFGLPLILFEAGEEMGDIEFIRDKSLAGDWISVTGAIDAINDTIEYVPASGKTFFLYEAKIVIGSFKQATGGGIATVSNSAVRADLLIDTVVKDKTMIGVSSENDPYGSGGIGGKASGAGFGNFGNGKFIAQGLFLVGNASKKVEIKNTQDNGDAVATLSGWIETT